MKLLKRIVFTRKAEVDSADSRIEFCGEVASDALEHYTMITEIKEAIIKEIVSGLKNDISLRIEALKPEIAKQIIELNKLK